MCIEYILLTIFLIISIICIIINHKGRKKWKIIEEAKKEELEDIFKERWDKEEQSFKLKKIELQIEEKELQSALNRLQNSLNEKEERYNEVNQDLDLYRSGKMEEINNAAAEYEQHKQTIINQSIDDYRDLQIKRANEIIRDLVEAIKIEEDKLDEQRSKRAAINEQIRKQKELEEQQDFYRIQIDPNDINDIKILRDIAPRLRHPEAINKIIWSGYYQKPLAELRKRLLPNGDVSCIYMATRIKTKEMYIGQTTSFDKRLQEHTRSALGIGTLASSMLHRKMYEDGPEQFLWQILEVVPKEKLRERESYYIDFYKSNKFGLNTLSGDKNK